MDLDYTKLFSALKDRGIMQKTMQEDLNLSGSILGRLRHNSTVTTETIGKICEYLECTPNDIMEIKFDQDRLNFYKNKHKDSLKSQIAELQAKLKTLQEGEE